jgi:AcrR family transcriptional regulator
VARHRARSDESKEERRQTLLAAALALFDETAYADLKMSDVALRAGVAKGTVFLYFPTKEALFLALLEQLLGAWFDALDAALGGEPHLPGSPGSPEALAAAIVASLRGREALTKLLTLHATILEHNVGVDAVAAFKIWLFGRMQIVAAAIERALPSLGQDGDRGGGLALLFRLYALVVGTRQLCEAGPVAAEALRRPELAPVALSFEAELEGALVALLRGMATGRATNG